ncbi:Dyslexia-associated protein [Lucilia cuprina]|nr:Dyslexia-associated protein [Lucilia cuprina]
MRYLPEEIKLLRGKIFHPIPRQFPLYNLESRCPINEECAPVRVDVTTGICKCRREFVYPIMWITIYSDESGALIIYCESSASNEATTQLKSKLNLRQKRKPIKINGVGGLQEVRLPEKEPKSPMNGTISDQSQSKVKLSNLSEGLYTFKVNCHWGWYLCDNNTHTSTDDDKIFLALEVVSGPIGYQPKLPEILPRLAITTFKLTVMDTDNVTNFTTATITQCRRCCHFVLPNNNVTLNGTASSDDHEIMLRDEAKAVDMQNTRTPYVQLSNGGGMYYICFKGHDGIHVFVKPPTNSPPIAAAEQIWDCLIFLLIVILDNKFAYKLDHIKWFRFYRYIGIKPINGRRISGPNRVINNSNETVCYNGKVIILIDKKGIIFKNLILDSNATGLTLGLYEFELTVADENMWLKVVQEKNSPPIANAGGDQVLHYRLAAGQIVADTDNQPVMIVSIQHKHINKTGFVLNYNILIQAYESVRIQQCICTSRSYVVESSAINTAYEYFNVDTFRFKYIGDLKIQVRELQHDTRTKCSYIDILCELEMVRKDVPWMALAYRALYIKEYTKEMPLFEIE